MPNTASAKKRLRQNETARIRNRAQRSDLRTSVRRVNEAIDAYEKGVLVTIDNDLLMVQFYMGLGEQYNTIEAFEKSK